MLISTRTNACRSRLHIDLGSDAVLAIALEPVIGTSMLRWALDRHMLLETRDDDFISANQFKNRILMTEKSAKWFAVGQELPMAIIYTYFALVGMVFDRDNLIGNVILIYRLVIKTLFTLYHGLLLILAFQAKFGVPLPGCPLLASRGGRLEVDM